MPFTVAHPAFAVPLRRWLPVTALVVGSVVPDIALSARPVISYAATHSLVGLVTIDALLGVVVLALWSQLMRGPLESMAPHWLRVRLPATARDPWSDRRAIAATLGGLIVGSATHVGVDAITHVYGLPQHLDWLWISVGGTPLFAVLQDVLGLVGVVLLGWLVATQPSRGEPAPEGERPAYRHSWRALTPAVAMWLVSALAVFAVAIRLGVSVRGGGYFAWTLSLPVFVVALVVTCLVLRRRESEAAEG